SAIKRTKRRAGLRPKKVARRKTKWIPHKAPRSGRESQPSCAAEVSSGAGALRFASVPLASEDLLDGGVEFMGVARAAAASCEGASGQDAWCTNGYEAMQNAGCLPTCESEIRRLLRGEDTERVRVG